MKTLLITGAAKGIGLATAKHFSALGWYVGLFDIDNKALDELQNSGQFPNACYGYCDVTQRQSVEDALKQFSGETSGRLDALVNNAGVLSSDKFEEMSPAMLDAMIDVNVRGLTHMAHAAFPLLKQTASACMVNLCSVSSVHGLPLLAVYGSTKFYVNALTQALAIEWAPYGIRVTSVKPPLVDTAMGNAVCPQLAEKMAMDMQPEDVALAVQKAVEGDRESYILGGKSRAWALADRLLPETGRRALTRYLSGY